MLLCLELHVVFEQRYLKMMVCHQKNSYSLKMNKGADVDFTVGAGQKVLEKVANEVVKSRSMSSDETTHMVEDMEMEMEASLVVKRIIPDGELVPTDNVIRLNGINIEIEAGSKWTFKNDQGVMCTKIVVLYPEAT
eukprot:GHVH01011910.1.p1 GENE.GHVH01011910.1~~GHVH01011910.1.p1  ORF type:complete len:136 (+),score=17.48 GHVH01011910.1:93-500(+)